jgi:hypothetical protein
MSRSPRRNSRRNRPNNQGRRAGHVDFWYSPRPLPEVGKVVPAVEGGTLLRSLGDPPITGGTSAGHYFSAVVERASAVATALALSADLLDTTEADENGAPPL